MKGMLLCIGLLCSLWLKSQGTFDYYVSNTGNDANAGNSKQVPKKTIAGVASAVANGALAGQPLKIGFKSGDVFNETFEPGFPVHAGTYFESGAGNNFAVLNGSAVFDNGWMRSNGTDHVFEQAISLSGFNSYGINNVGQYSMVSVFEIDRVLERTAPFTARKLLRFVPGIQAADSIAGSFYEPVTVNVNPKTIYIHTSDGNAPNNHPRYRYEVTVRDRAINSTYHQSNYYERLWVRGYGAGNGMIPAGANSTFNRMILGPGAGIHHLGLRGASINNSLFLPGAKGTSEYAVVFYDVEGYNRHNSIKNSIFLDIRYPVYAHTSFGTNFGALELDNVIAFADSSEAESFLELGNTDTLIMKDIYASKYKKCYNGHAKFVSVKNAVITDAVNGLMFSDNNLNCTVGNCFIKTAGKERVWGISVSSNANFMLSNSIIHLRNDKVSPDIIPIGVFVDGLGTNNNYTTVSGNIFICDTDPSKYTLAASNNGPEASNFRWFNNVYILLRGQGINWQLSNGTVSNPRPEIVSFENWKLRTGQDGNSLFFDLRNDPRGLNAIFVDPANGDYSLTNTFEANKIRELKAGMISPISCFLKKPSYEEAADIILHDAVLTANACRNPCVQNSIRISHRFNESLQPGRKIQLQWDIEDERGIDHYELLRSFGNADFSSIAYVPASGLASYELTDSNVMPGITYRYSLVVVTRLQEKCYSEVRSVKLEAGKQVTIYPNPSPGRVRLSLNDYAGPVKVNVVNVLGITVFSKVYNSLYGVPAELDLTLQSKGFYWLHVQTDKDNSFQGLILK